MDKLHPDQNPFGYRDSSAFIRTNRALPIGYQAIKLFDFDFARLPELNPAEHSYIIALRHPSSCLGSTRDVVKRIASDETTKKSIRAYIAAYDYVRNNIAPRSPMVAFIDFDDYPNVGDRFREIVPTITNAAIESVWQQEVVRYRAPAATQQCDPSLRDAMAVYMSLRGRDET